MIKKDIEKNISIITLLSLVFLWTIQVDLFSMKVPVFPSFFVLLSFFAIGNFSIKIKNLFLALFFILAMSVLQYAVGAFFESPLRSLGGIFVFSVYLVALYSVIDFIDTEGCSVDLLVFSKKFIFLQFFVQIVQLVMFYLGFNVTSYRLSPSFPRVSGLFLEPSHLAFSLSPYLYLLFFKNEILKRSLGKGGYLALLLVFVLSPSATLVAVILMLSAFGVLTNIRSLSVFFKSAVIAFFSFMLVLNIEFVNERFFDLYMMLKNPNFYSLNYNISAMTYFKGVQMSLSGILDYGIGVGFLNFQFLNDASFVSLLSEHMYQNNKFGGASTLLKICGEFGLLGFLVSLGSLLVFCLKHVKSRSENYFSMHAFVLFGMIATYIRGASYFDGVYIAGLAALMLTLKHYRYGKALY